MLDVYTCVLADEIEAIPQVFVLDDELEVLLDGVILLLRDVEQVLSQLHVANENFLNNADACNESVLVVGNALHGAALCIQAEIVPHFVL